MIPAGSLSGRLIDAAGKAVPGVEMLIQAADWQVFVRRTVKTDSHGEFSVKDVAPSAYDITVGQEAPVTAKAAAAMVKAGETVRVADMRAIPGAVLSGRVLDADTRKPVGSGYVYATGAMSSPRSANTARVDSKGRYKFTVYPGRISVHYSGDSSSLYRFDRSSRNIKVAACGLRGLAIFAKPGKPVSGKVLDTAGKPVAGALVSVSGDWGPEVKTDKSGRFSVIVDPKPREWGDEKERNMLVFGVVDQAGKRGVHESTTRDKVVGKGDMVITVKPAKTLVLAVKDDQGKPLEGVEASVVAMNGNMSRSREPVKTDSAGKVTFDVYDGGQYYLNATKKGYYHDNQRIKLLPNIGTPEWTGTAELVMEPAHRTQRGVVVDESGAPVAGARVEMGFSNTTTTDSKGEFVLEGLPDSQVELSVQSSDRYGYASVSKKTDIATIKLRKMR